jgi:hypothetical protein
MHLYPFEDRRAAILSLSLTLVTCQGKLNLAIKKRKRNFYSGLCKSFAHNQFLLEKQPLKKQKQQR